MMSCQLKARSYLTGFDLPLIKKYQNGNIEPTLTEPTTTQISIQLCVRACVWEETVRGEREREEEEEEEEVMLLLRNAF